jgi:hypothetical protein
MNPNKLISMSAPYLKQLSIIFCAPISFLCGKHHATRLFSYLLLAIGVSFSVSTWAQPAKPQTLPQVDSDWRFLVAPYLWLTRVSGSVYYGGSEISSSTITAGNILSHLNFGGMVELEAHKGDFGVIADIIYASLGNTASKPVGPRVNVGADTTITQLVYTVAGTYTVAKSPGLYTEVLLGGRIIQLDSKTNYSINGETPIGMTVSANTTIIDPIVGLKGRVRISDSDWFVPFYADIGGGGSSQVTTMAFLGVGRSFDWGDAVLGVKNLYFQQKNQGLTTNTNLLGVAMGVGFRF